MVGFTTESEHIALYGTTNNLPHPFKGLTEEYIVTKTREVMMFKNSKDPRVATASVEVCTGRRWNSSLELQITEERLRHKPLVGRVAVGPTGLGYFTSKEIRRAMGEEYQHLLQNKMEAGVEEIRFGKMVVLAQKGAWSQWDSILKKKVSWSDICGSNLVHI